MGAGRSVTNLAKPCFRAAALVVALSGCNAFRDRMPNNSAPRPRPASAGNIDVGRIADQLNANSRAIQSVSCNRVYISGQAKNPNGGVDRFTVDAQLAFQAPSNLRMRGTFAGRPEIDLGSNEEEIWFWARRADPNKLLVCARRELSHLDLAIPFHPDALAEVLGVIEIDPSRWEPGEEKGDMYYIKSNQATPDGRPALKTLTFRRIAGKPDRLVRISLRDARKPLVVLADATIEEWYEEPRLHIAVPRSVQLEWPDQDTKLRLVLKRGAVDVNTIDAAYAAKLFSRTGLSQGKELLDMARVRRPAMVSGAESIRPTAAGEPSSDAPAPDPRRGPRKLRELDR